MDHRLLVILLSAGLPLAAGGFLIYLGFVSPIFRRSSEVLAPDPSVRTFRIIARIMGPVLCLLAGLRVTADIWNKNTPQELAWHEYVSTEGRFRVSVPGEVSIETKQEKSGDAWMAEQYYHAGVAGLPFYVSFHDLPDYVTVADKAKTLHQELDAHLHAPGVELVSQNDTTVGGNPALHFTLHDPRHGFFVEGMFILAGKRRYQLAVQYLNDLSTGSRQRFFESFEIVNAP